MHCGTEGAPVEAVGSEVGLAASWSATAEVVDSAAGPVAAAGAAGFLLTSASTYPFPHQIQSSRMRRFTIFLPSSLLTFGTDVGMW